MSRNRLVTPLGWAMLTGALLAGSIGWWLGWVEFVALGVGCLLAVMTAVPFVLGGSELRIDRVVEPDRVSVGEVARSVLRMRNEGSGRSAARIVTDRIGEVQHLIDVEPMGRGESVVHPLPLPTSKRAVINVGPAEVSKGDPLGLLRRALGRSARTEFFVHPRLFPLASLQSGFVKDLEGPTFDTSPAGDVAFHTIREYEPGDDVRHIHWMSSARTGSLMIRHYVDNRRPYLGVLVDNRSESLTPAAFERVIEVAASQVVSASLDVRPISVWVGKEQIATLERPADVRTALDRFSACAQTPDELDLVRLQGVIRRVDPDISALLVLTGKLDPRDLLPLVTLAVRDVAVLVGRCGPPGDERAVPQARTIDFADASSFAHQWQGLIA
jgi:uncharacterized protein (DUF58 family)